MRPNVLSYAFHTSKAVHTAYTTQNVKGSIFLLQRACTSMRLKEVCWAIVSGLIIYAVPRNLYNPANPYHFNQNHFFWIRYYRLKPFRNKMWLRDFFKYMQQLFRPELDSELLDDRTKVLGVLAADNDGMCLMGN